MTSSSTSYPIRDILSNSDTSLGKLIAKAQAIENLNQTFQNILDPSLIPHCRIATYENGILILVSESAAYATRLRYQVPTILSTLRNFSQWAALRSIQIKVKSPIDLKNTPTCAENPPGEMTENNIENIKELVSKLKSTPGNEALIASLERLIPFESFD